MKIRIAIVALLALIPSTGEAATAIVPASKDNSIFEDGPDNSAGGAAGIYAGHVASGAARRGLIAFDVAANVPTGSIITSAELTLYLSIAGSSVEEPVGIHRLTTDWGEGDAGSALPTVRRGGAGSAAGPGDATWSAGAHLGALWTRSGGDFVSNASSVAQVGSATESPYVWPSTPAMVSDVQNWLDNPAANFGWAIVHGSAAGAFTGRGFYSRSATLNDSGEPLNLLWRPALTITYAIPEPAAIWPAALGLSVLGWIRLRRG